MWIVREGDFLKCVSTLVVRLIIKFLCIYISYFYANEHHICSKTQAPVYINVQLSMYFSGISDEIPQYYLSFLLKSPSDQAMVIPVPFKGILNQYYLGSY